MLLCVSVQNEVHSYKTTNAFVDTGFLALWKITVITVLLLAHYRNIVASLCVPAKCLSLPKLNSTS